MTTTDGKGLHTCPYDMPLQPASASLFAYPNPVRSGGSVTLEHSAPSAPGSSTAKIYSLQGSLVSEQKLTGSSTTISLPLPPGLYLIIVNDEVVRMFVEQE